MEEGSFSSSSSVATARATACTTATPAAPNRNPYACRRSVSTASTSSSTASTSTAPGGGRRRTLTDVNQQRHHHRPESSSSSSSSLSTVWSTTTKKSQRISPKSALQLYRSLPHHSSSAAPYRQGGGVGGTVHLLSDHCAWTQLDAGRIHELAGAAGTAKTQLALQACVDCAVQGYDCSYLSLKNGNSASALARLAHRLNQMIPAAATSSTTSTTTTTATSALQHRHDILSRIHLRGIRNADELVNEDLHALRSTTTTTNCSSSSNNNSRQRTTTTAGNATTIRLLVIDSVADVFRGDVTTDYPQRALRFVQWVLALRRDYVHCPILMLNQVTLHDTLPALGLTWAHCVNASFLVQKHNWDGSSSSTNNVTTGQSPPPPQRILSLRRSPVHGPHSINFVVATCGCRVVAAPPAPR